MFQGRCNNYHAGEVQNDLRGGAHLPTPPLCEQLVVKCRELQPLQKKHYFNLIKIYYISSQNDQSITQSKVSGILNILPSADMSSDSFAFVTTSS